MTEEQKAERKTLIANNKAMESVLLTELHRRDLTLQFLEEKRTDARRSANRDPIDLGMPAIR